jgi:hypothetical protein
MDQMPACERERSWAVLGLVVLVLLMGAGALVLAFSGYPWV